MLRGAYSFRKKKGSSVVYTALLSYFEKIAHMSVVLAYVSLWLCGSVALWLCMLGCLLQEPIRLKVL